MRRTVLQAGAALALLLSGCTVGPDHAAPAAALPSSWSVPVATSPVAVAQGAWWRRFGDPVLDRLVTASLAANPDVQHARAALQASRAQLAQKTAGLFPTLDTSGSAAHQRISLAASGLSNVPGGSGAVAYSTWQAGFDASFELDVFGGQRRSIEGASASAEASEADVDATVLSLLGDVANAYVQARGYRERLQVARETLASWRDTAALTRGRAQAGLAAGLDATRAEAEATRAEAAIPPLEQSYRAQVNSLSALTGISIPDLLAQIPGDAPIPALSGTVVVDAPATLLARRPDIRAAERRLAAATAAIGAAEADRYPAISFAGTLGLNASRLRDLGEVSSRVWSIAPQVSLPVFDAGRRAAVVQQRVAERDEALASWRSTVLTAVREVEDALNALDRERAHNDLLRSSAATYADAARVARAQYTAGLSNFLDVLDAERSLADAQDALAQSDPALATQAIALFKALGGGWEVARS
jgi:NodT family efflux transporter outer membrane factor (OMF) lipoprotein